MYNKICSMKPSFSYSTQLISPKITRLFLINRNMCKNRRDLSKNVQRESAKQNLKE